MTTLVNLTPHALSLHTGDAVITIPASGTVARVTSTPGALAAETFAINGATFAFAVAGATVFGEVEGLPPPTPGTVFVVSALVGSALKGTRPDVLCPGTGPNDGAVRNEKGQIVGVTRLVRV